MSRKVVEQRLVEVSGRMRRLQDELRVADEQLEHFAHEAEDARIRALVSENSGAGREHREAEKHAAAMRRHRDELRSELTQLDATQNELLDRLVAEK